MGERRRVHDTVRRQRQRGIRDGATGFVPETGLVPAGVTFAFAVVAGAGVVAAGVAATTAWSRLILEIT